MCRIGFASFWVLLFSIQTFADQPAVTFNKDVLPAVQRKCQTCHRPGEMVPMSFLSCPATRPWAKAIKAVVLTKKMPPWAPTQGTVTSRMAYHSPQLRSTPL